MAIYKYFAGRDKFVLPTVHTGRDSSLSKWKIDKANDGRKQVLDTSANSHQVGITYQESDLR